MAIFDGGWQSRLKSRRLASTLAGGAILLAVLSAGTWTHEARAQGAVKSVHGDWQIRCDTPPGAQNEQCALIQLSLIHI